MTETSSEQFGEAYAEYQTNRGVLRKAIRRLYLRHAASFCEGPTLDFGCGIGELLALLPAGSCGLEVNPFAVAQCRAKGLVANLYDPANDQYRLDGIPFGTFRTLVTSHVLEHLEEPDQVLRSLLNSSSRIGIRTVLVIVPGAKGFASDSTHKTFITHRYLQEKGIFELQGVRTVALNYFPGNIRAIGALFPHHEMKVVFDVAAAQVAG